MQLAKQGREEVSDQRWTAIARIADDKPEIVSLFAFWDVYEAFC
jgi:hypothetical protein